MLIEAGDTTTISERPATPDAVSVRGRSVDRVEAFSVRAPFPVPVAEEDRWLLTGVAEAFDATFAG